jgi:hypothetical protein
VRCLAGAGIVLEQYVPVGQQSDEHELDHFVPAANRRPKARAETVRDFAGAGETVVDG